VVDSCPAFAANAPPTWRSPKGAASYIVGCHQSLLLRGEGKVGSSRTTSVVLLRDKGVMSCPSIT